MFYSYSNQIAALLPFVYIGNNMVTSMDNIAINQRFVTFDITVTVIATNSTSIMSVRWGAWALATHRKGISAWEALWVLKGPDGSVRPSGGPAAAQGPEGA
jgi:hypothetical protein